MGRPSRWPTTSSRRYRSARCVCTYVVRPSRRIELIGRSSGRGRAPADAVLGLADAHPGRRRRRGRTRRAPAATAHRQPAGVAEASARTWPTTGPWRGFAAGSFDAPGPPAAATPPRCELVAGGPMTPLQHLLVMTEAAGGVSAELRTEGSKFANVDLVLSLHRPPRGDSLGMDASDALGGRGRPSASPSSSRGKGAIGRSAPRCSWSRADLAAACPGRAAMVDTTRWTSRCADRTPGLALRPGLEVMLMIIGSVLLARFVSWVGGRITVRIDSRSTARPSGALRGRQAPALAGAGAHLGGHRPDLLDRGVLRARSARRTAHRPRRAGTVLGVALGFGAQRIVGDVLAGFFLITERQYGFGDVIRISVPGAGEPTTAPSRTSPCGSPRCARPTARWIICPTADRAGHQPVARLGPRGDRRPVPATST